MRLNELQQAVGEWSRRNFPNNKPYHPLLGLQEEIGELSHAHLKGEQGIREGAGDPGALIEKKMDAVGDIVIYLADYCSRNGIDFEVAVSLTWAVVRERNWRANPKAG